MPPLFTTLINLIESNPGFFLFAIALLGLTIGSFLNVVIHRLPIMLEREWHEQCKQLEESADTSTTQETYNLVVPRSRCPHCGHWIKAIENIPLVSYLLQKGKCSACGAAISWRYPAVELLSAILSVIVIWNLGFTLVGFSALVLTWALIALSFIDIDRQLLPDNITLPLLWAGLLLNLFEVHTTLESAVIGAVSAYLFLWLIFQLFKLLTGKEGMGYGDFKLYAVFGAWLGWQLVPLIILMASFVGAILGVAAIMLQGKDHRIPIPFGPYLAIAGWITMLWGEPIMQSYLTLARIPY